jgi:hypothetical protein
LAYPLDSIGVFGAVLSRVLIAVERAGLRIDREKPKRPAGVGRHPPDLAQEEVNVAVIEEIDRPASEIARQVFLGQAEPLNVALDPTLSLLAPLGGEIGGRRLLDDHIEKRDAARDMHAKLRGRDALERIRSAERVADFVARQEALD